MAKKIFRQEELEILTEDFKDLKEYLEELKKVLPVAICTLTPLWIMVDANKALIDLTGYKYLEIIGQPVGFIFGDRGKLEKIKKEAEENKTVINTEMTLAARDQKRIPVNVSLVSRRDQEGNMIGFFLTIIDATATRESQNQLIARTKEVEDSRSALLNMLEDVEEARSSAEEEKNKTLAVVTNLTDGILVFDEENRLSLMNPLAEKFFDIKAKDLTDRSILELRAFPTLKPLTKVLTEEIGEIFRREVLVKKDLTLEISTVPVLRKKKRIGNLVILHDITREKLVERMKTEFVSLAAHQLRTPLSAIKWTLRMLLDGDLGKITEEQRDFITKTYQSNERMITLINNLLDITRIEEGRYIYKPALTEFEPIVGFVLDSCKEEAERKKIKIEFRKPKKKSSRVMVDVEKIRLAVENLLENAIKYTQAGGKVIVLLKNAPGKIELSVKDSGVGIPKDQQERVFAKFFRGANVIRMETEGTGLGLFITKNIVEAHGGKIWFESEENKGSTFYLTLPTKEEFEGFLREF